jgi:hypothetical protein
MKYKEIYWKPYLKERRNSIFWFGVYAIIFLSIHLFLDWYFRCKLETMNLIPNIYIYHFQGLIEGMFLGIGMLFVFCMFASIYQYEGLKKSEDFINA